jgi:hypothetical protein
MVKEKTCPITIYPSESLKLRIIERAKNLHRSQNEDILYLIEQGLAFEDIKSAQIMSLLKEQSPKYTE